MEWIIIAAICTSVGAFVWWCRPKETSDNAENNASSAVSKEATITPTFRPGTYRSYNDPPRDYSKPYTLPVDRTYRHNTKEISPVAAAIGGALAGAAVSELMHSSSRRSSNDDSYTSPISEPVSQPARGGSYGGGGSSDDWSKSPDADDSTNDISTPDPD